MSETWPRNQYNDTAGISWNFGIQKFSVGIFIPYFAQLKPPVKEDNAD